MREVATACQKKTEAISGGAEMASECRLCGEGERGRSRVKKKPRGGDFFGFHVACVIKTFPSL